MLGDYSHPRRSHPLSFQLLSLEDRWPVERSKVEKATFLATRRDDFVYTMCRCRSRLCNPQKKGIDWRREKVKGSCGKGLKGGTTINVNDEWNKWTFYDIIVCLRIRFFIMFANCYRYDYQVSRVHRSKNFINNIWYQESGDGLFFVVLNLVIKLIWKFWYKSF